MERLNFLEEITQVINRYSEENKSNTPDFILAQYMRDCLDVLNKTIKTRDAWYGRTTSPVDETDPIIFPKEISKCSHPKEFAIEKIEYDCFPYVDTMKTRTCSKCGHVEFFDVSENK